MRRAAVAMAAALCGLGALGCDVAYSEVALRNATEAPLILRHLSFVGCLWEQTLEYGGTTAPHACPPGQGRVHFEKLDTRTPSGWRGGADDDAAARARTADESAPVPVWFPYQTRSTYELGYGEFRVLSVTSDDLEQDFEAPAPFGH